MYGLLPDEDKDVCQCSVHTQQLQQKVREYTVTKMPALSMVATTETLAALGGLIYMT